MSFPHFGRCHQAGVVLLCWLALRATNAREIEGQVFIVTKAHESVKLGLVTLAAFKPDDFSKVIELTRESFTPAQKELKDLRPFAAKASDQAEELYHAVLFSDSRTFGNIEKSDAVEITSGVATEIESVLYAVDRGLAYYGSATPFFERLPMPTAKTQTDADGKFSLTIPLDESVIIAANATRQTVDSTENYFWAVKVDRPVRSLILSNNNLTDSSSDESVLRTSPIEGVSSVPDSAENFKTRLKGLVADLSKLKASVTGISTKEEPTAAVPTPTVHLVQSLELRVKYGTVTLNRGAEFHLVAREGANVRVTYLGSDYTIPISATDLK